MSFCAPWTPPTKVAPYVSRPYAPLRDRWESVLIPYNWSREVLQPWLDLHSWTADALWEALSTLAKLERLEVERSDAEFENWVDHVLAWLVSRFLLAGVLVGCSNDDLDSISRRPSG